MTGFAGVSASLVQTCSFSTNVAPGLRLSQASCSPFMLVGWGPANAEKAETGIGLGSSPLSMSSYVTVCLLDPPSVPTWMSVSVPIRSDLPAAGRNAVRMGWQVRQTISPAILSRRPFAFVTSRTS